MKSTVVVVVFLLSCESLFSQYYLADVPFDLSEINKRDDKGKHGVWFFYYKKDSVVYAMKTFHNDTLDGYFEMYWPSGIVSDKGYYKSGVLDSLCLGYWESGSIRALANYTGGKLNGPSKAYSRDGVLYYNVIYIDNELDTNCSECFIKEGFGLDNSVKRQGNH